MTPTGDDVEGGGAMGGPMSGAAWYLLPPPPAQRRGLLVCRICTIIGLLFLIAGAVTICIGYTWREERNIEQSIERFVLYQVCVKFGKKKNFRREIEIFSENKRGVLFFWEKTLAENSQFDKKFSREIQIYGEKGFGGNPNFLMCSRKIRYFWENCFDGKWEFFE